MSPFTTLMLAAVLIPGQSDSSLTWKLKKDDTFYVKTANTIKQTIQVLGMDQDQDQESTTYHKYKVLSADKDGIVVEQTIQKADMKSPLPGAENIGAKMKGLKLTYTLNAKNEVSKVEGYDKFLDAISGDNDMAKELMKLTMSEDTLKMGVSDVFGFIPNKAVKAGDTWKREYKFSLGPLGDFAINADYKWAETGEKGDKITWTATTKYNAPKGDAGGLPFSISKGELKAEKFEGEYLFDSKAGRLKSGTTNAKINGKMTISAGGMEIEMGLKQDVTTKVTVSDKSLADD
jgi:hypothetical protein